jgi:hypothetical protein
MHVENLDVLVGVVFPKLDGVFAANMDVQRATRKVLLRVIGEFSRLHADGDKTISQQPLVAAGKRFKKLNDA